MRAAHRTAGAAILASLVFLVPQVAFAADSDGDGVPDNVDAFPNDGTLSSEAYAPAQQQFGQILFEDLWPAQGDFDFNDVGVAYNYLFQLNAQAKVVNLKGSFTVLSAGASIHNRLLVHLPIPVGSVASVTLNGLNQAVMNVTPKQGESDLIVEITPDILALFANDTLVNTDPAKTSQAGVPFNLLVRLSTPTSVDMGQAPFDVFIARVDEAGREIHLPQYAGTTTMNQSLFNTADDGSTMNRHFVTTNGIPFVLVVPYELAWPSERVRLDVAYPDIIPFGNSGGASNTDWYLTNVNPPSLWTGGANNTPVPVAQIIPPDFPGPNNACLNQPNGTACNDGDLCTKNDACQNGACVGVAYSCPAPDSCHNAGACLGDGSCSTSNKADGTMCNDNDPCSLGDVCTNGVCGGSPKCAPPNDCQTAMCDPMGGACTFVNKMNGTACAGGGLCTAGQCVVGCAANLADCDGNQGNGCEVNLTTDANHCGACGNVCSGANGMASCVNGACQIACNAGFANCDNNAANGCEVNIAGNVNNCGGCGNVCGSANGMAGCAMGMCTISCNAGFGNCDNNNANGCETNLLTSAGNCGQCGMACMGQNGAAACSNGMCVAGMCNAGFADCDGNPANGCETNITNNAANCGGCGMTCNLPNVNTSACVNSVCTVVACGGSFSNCDNNSANGCETNISNNAANCGSCGAVCSSNNVMALCSGGTCAGACSPGFGDCNGNKRSDGCETNINGDVNNCGSCGSNCAQQCVGQVAGVACQSGACAVAACSPGWLDVNLQCADGCECQATTDSAVCANPSSFGVMQLGQASVRGSTLVPAGREIYYSVTFASASNLSFHPHVSLIANPNNAFQFDVLSACGVPMGCAEGGVAAGRTDWELAYSGGDASSPGFIPMPPPGNNGTVLIRVFRAPGKPVICDSFTLRVAN